MCRVLIADDEPKVLLLIKSLIEWDRLGLELVATANDGVSALALIEELRPDIVITDIRMPGYDGIELIGRAKELNPAIDFIIISGYRHFDYAQKAIRYGVEDYLLKPLKAVEINQTLGKMIEKYRVRDLARQHEARVSVRLEKDAQLLHERFMAKLVRGAATVGDALPDGDLARVNQEFELALQAGFFQMFAVKADVDAAALAANARRMLLEKTVGAIRDALRGQCHACYLYADERGVFGLLNFDETQKKAIRKALVAVIDELQSQYEIFDRIKVSIGLGSQSTDLREMVTSAREAELAMLNRLILGTGRVIDRAVPENRAAIVARVIATDVRKRLLAGVEVLDAQEVAAVIESVRMEAERCDNLTGAAVLALFDECRQILRFGLKAQEAVDTWVEAQIPVIDDRLAMCSSVREVFVLLSDYALSLIDHVVTLKKSENARPVREAQKYIHAHFAEPIGLEAVSQWVDLNPTYFSALFKKEAGMNFLEYLTDVRIREAKRLLSDPRKTIADVAADVGYNDVKHFSRVFARSTGIQPSKYRKLYY